MNNFPRIFIFLIIFSLYSLRLYGQTGNAIPVTKQRVVELDAVQTKKNTFLVAAMTIADAPAYSEVTILRSVDIGKSWSTVFILSQTAKFQQNADPVITVDSVGNIYLVLMRIDRTLNLPNAQLWCYKSTDDGLTWSLAGKPFGLNNGFSDYPQIYAKEDGKVFMSYTLQVDHFLPLFSSPLLINFSKSTNSGSNWSASKLLPSVSDLKWYVGSDISESANNRLHVAYGDYNSSSIYHVFSSDEGETWSELHIIKELGSFLINKVISNKKLEHLAIVSHEPHNVKTPIYFSSSEDNGNTWDTKIIVTSAAYAESILDDKGNYHVIYNQIVENKFNIGYIYSEDKGQTFSNPVILYSMPKSNFNYGSSGEYQSLILASDGMFHLTFIDYGDTLKAKQVIFPPKLVSDIDSQALSTLPLLYPLPAKDVLHIKLEDGENACSYQVLDLSGRIIVSGVSSSRAFAINLSYIPAGTFILNLSLNNRTFINKFIKIE